MTSQSVDAMTDKSSTRSLLADALGIPAARQTPSEVQRLKVVMVKELGWFYTRNVRIRNEEGSKQGTGYQRKSED